MALNFKTDKEILEKISKRLLAKRKASGLSQKELAKKAGVSFRTVQTLERGGNPTIVNFIAIVRALGELQALTKLMENKENSHDSLSPKEIHKGSKG